MSKVLTASTVITNRPFDDRYFYLELEAPQIARQYEPGQFVMVRCGSPGSFDPLLPRPLTPVAAEPDAGRLGLLYAPAGRGRGWLAERRPGDRLTVWGPLGRGYRVGAGPAILAGSGRHLAALFPLARRLAVRGSPFRLIGLTGLPDSDASPLPEDLEVEVSEPGEVDWNSAGQIFLAGSPELYRLVARLIPPEAAGRIQVLVEAPMACGVGACFGCTVWTQAGPVRACVEGPVFALAGLEFPT
jgi:dihydroorotate dehydrogenase electron transfer subunit